MMRTRFNRYCTIAVAAAVLLLASCKSDRQHQAEIDAKIEAHRAQLEHQLRIAEIQSETARQVAVLEADTKRRRDREVMGTIRTVGIIGLIAAVIAAFGFWVRQVAIRSVVENQKSARFSEAMTLLTDRNNGLSDAQREVLVAKVIESSSQSLLTHNPS